MSIFYIINVNFLRNDVDFLRNWHLMDIFKRDLKYYLIINLIRRVILYQSDSIKADIVIWAYG